MLVSYTIKAICCFNKNSEIFVEQEYRYSLFVLSEILYGLAMSLAMTFSAKVAYDWFPFNETIRVIILCVIGFSISSIATNLITPRLVTKPDELDRLGYVYVISVLILSLIIMLCIRNSQPPTPPSERSIITQQSTVPLKDGFIVVSVREGKKYIMNIISIYIYSNNDQSFNYTYTIMNMY